MSRRVFVHIGLPKTGTSYLQSIVWGNRDALREQGMLLPGRERRDHLWSSLVVREDPNVERRNPRAAGSWDVLRSQIAEWDGDALISHEFFCSASAEQAARMVEQLSEDGAEVHVVITAREPLSLFTSSWQEHLKNKGTKPMANYGRRVSEDPTVIWNWRALDLGLVLERWLPAVPSPDRIHVITPPPKDAPRTELLNRFSDVLGLKPERFTIESFANASMGVVEAETLRRINTHLDDFRGAFDRGVWIRSYLADDRLVPRKGEPFWPGEDQIADARERALRAHSLLRTSGVEVIGDPDSLLVPDELPERRHPDSVTDAEVADCAAALVAELLGDIRETTRELRAAQRNEE